MPILVPRVILAAALLLSFGDIVLAEPKAAPAVVEDQRLHESARIAFRGRSNEAHFVTDGYPVAFGNTGRAIGSRCAVGEVDGENGRKNEKRRGACFHGSMLRLCDTNDGYDEG